VHKLLIAKDPKGDGYKLHILIPSDQISFAFDNRDALARYLEKVGVPPVDLAALSVGPEPSTLTLDEVEGALDIPENPWRKAYRLARSS